MEECGGGEFSKKKSEREIKERRSLKKKKGPPGSIPVRRPREKNYLIGGKKRSMIGIDAGKGVRRRGEKAIQKKNGRMEGKPSEDRDREALEGGKGENWKNGKMQSLEKIPTKTIGFKKGRKNVGA